MHRVLLNKNKTKGNNAKLKYNYIPLLNSWKHKIKDHDRKIHKEIHAILHNYIYIYLYDFYNFFFLK